MVLEPSFTFSGRPLSVRVSGSHTPIRVIQPPRCSCVTLILILPTGFLPLRVDDAPLTPNAGSEAQSHNQKLGDSSSTPCMLVVSTFDSNLPANHHPKNVLSPRLALSDVCVRQCLPPPISARISLGTLACKCIDPPPLLLTTGSIAVPPNWCTRAMHNKTQVPSPSFL